MGAQKRVDGPKIVFRILAGRILWVGWVRRSFGVVKCEGVKEKVVPILENSGGPGWGANIAGDTEVSYF